MLPRPLRQESLSKAYVRAIAARAGLIFVQGEYDFGVDVGLRAVIQRGTWWVDGGVQANLQIKSTMRASVSEDSIAYDLDPRTYENLRNTKPMSPLYLVVLIMPDDESLWLTQDLDQLILRHCAYWLSLEGYPATQATSSVRVKIPRANVFSVAFVEAIMQQLLERSQP
jgi:hypothetical protein